MASTHPNAVRSRKRRTAAKERYFRYLAEYLRDHPCVDCGATDPMILEFDHVRGKKKMDVNRLVHEGYSLRIIKAEIRKCEVVCANDHRRRSAMRGKHARWMKLGGVYAQMQALERVQGKKPAKVRV